MSALRTVLGREVGDILADPDFAGLVCSPTVEMSRGVLTVTLQFGPTGELDLIELMNRLRYLEGLGHVRAFAQAYNIDHERLERCIPGLTGSTSTEETT